MSKVANMLNMLQILKDEKIHSIQELAEKLEVSERMVRQYKVELEQTGIYINSITGRYGGYKIETHIVDASKVGVPQKRKRLIIIGSKTHNINLKEEIEKYIKLYKISSELNVYDAISDLSYLNSGEGSHNSDYIVDAKTKYQLKRRKNSKMLFNHFS